MTGPASSAFETVPSLRVGDVMHRGLVSCDADTPLDTVAALMSTERIHCVVVEHNNAAGPAWGIVSDLDLVAAAIVRPLAEQRAGGTAMRPAVTVVPSEALDVAAGLMARNGVAHLVVVDTVEQRPVGVLSTLDLTGALSNA